MTKRPLKDATNEMILAWWLDTEMNYRSMAEKAAIYHFAVDPATRTAEAYLRRRVKQLPQVMAMLPRLKPPTTADYRRAYHRLKNKRDDIN